MRTRNKEARSTEQREKKVGEYKDRKIKGTKQEVVIPGENMVIVGFMELSNGGQSILSNYDNIYGSKNYSNYLYKVLYDTLEIKNIDQDSKGIKIEFQAIADANHFFSKSENMLVKCLDKYIKKETALY